MDELLHFKEAFISLSLTLFLVVFCLYLKINGGKNAHADVFLSYGFTFDNSILYREEMGKKSVSNHITLLFIPKLTGPYECLQGRWVKLYLVIQQQRKKEKSKPLKLTSTPSSR